MSVPGMATVATGSSSATNLQMSGGANAIVGTISKMLNDMDSPAKVLFGVLLVILIAFSEQVPIMYRSLADTLIGRLCGVGAIMLAVRYAGWVYGLLVVLAYLLLLQSSGGGGGEGFENQIVKETIGKRWYVEKVLGERPQRIDTEVVQTLQVTDNSQKSM